MKQAFTLKAGQSLATLAGGCFWGMEDLIRKIPGVLNTEVGYTGGTSQDPSYPTVKTSATGHAEAVQILFDPSVLSFEDLLRWFFRMHDPTTMDRQGNDIGSQYRSAIFYHDTTQSAAAERIRDEFKPLWKKPIVTQIVPAGDFYAAESYHQDYLQKNPAGYTCHWIRDI
jgi:methionine-S-sulfoxide reductase